MFFKNLLKTKKMRAKNFQFPAFCGMVTDSASAICDTAYNFCVNNGMLSSCCGFSELYLPISESGGEERKITFGDDAKCDLWLLPYYDQLSGTRQDKLFWSFENGNIGYVSVIGLSKTGVLLETGFTEPPTANAYTINNEDKILFSAPGILASLTNADFATQEAVLPKFVDLCEVFERLFGIVDGKRNQILYSENLDPTLWVENENAITLNDEQGACNKMIKFSDDLFVFRDFGITRISEYGISKEYEIFNVFTHKTKIYGKTVVRCGTQILFLARNGLYAFNGSRVSKVDINLSHLLQNYDNVNAAACFDGKNYILACRLDFNDENLIGVENYADGYINNALVVYDVFTGKCDIVRGVDVRCLLKLNSGSVDKVLATFYGEHASKIGVLDFSGAVFGGVLPKFWQSKKLTFSSPEKTKIFKKLFLQTTQDLILTLSTDLEKESFVVVGQKDLQAIKFFLRGKHLRFSVLADYAGLVLPPKVFFEEEK